MAVAPISPSEPAAPARAGAAQCATAAAAPSTGRALVLRGSAAGGTGPAGPRPSAAFLAQLIATAQQAPQTRQRRRAEPQDANAFYAAVATPAAWIGRAVCRAS
jgi:hypothetical protein